MPFVPLVGKRCSAKFGFCRPAAPDSIQESSVNDTTRSCGFSPGMRDVTI